MLLSGRMSTGRITPWMRTNSRPWLISIHFWPRTTRLPFERRFATVTVTLPCRRLDRLLSPLPSKLRLFSMLAESSLPPIDSGEPARMGAVMSTDVSFAVVVLELFCAAVFSDRMMVTVSPTRWATWFSNSGRS
jgi:hypothetical protein